MIGRRDRALLLVALQTGLRNSELVSLRHRDVSLGVGAHVRCFGKGRKMRCTPLQPDVAEVLAGWLAEQRAGPEDPLSPARAAARSVPKRCSASSPVTPTQPARHAHRLPDRHAHTLRHTAAMDLLRRGVDLTVIALWLGHESTETTRATCTPI